MKVRVNKELIFKLSQSVYWSKGEASKNISSTFQLHLHETLQKKKGIYLRYTDSETSLSERCRFCLIASVNPTMSEGKVYKNVNMLKK